jgi:protoporphyrinogen oxidase
MAPPGRTSLAVEIFTSHGEPAWELSNDELVERATREMEAIGFLHRSFVRDAWVVRIRHAYPVYDIGYAERLHQVKTFLSRWPRLHLVGRTGAFRYMNADGAMEDAFALVDYITGQAHQRPDVMATYRVI